MDFKIYGKDYQLAFGLKFIKELDKTYTQKVEGMEFGIGVETAIMYLQMKNPVVLFEIIKAGTAHLKSKPPNTHIEKELEERAQNDMLYDLFDEFQGAMEESVFLRPKLKQIAQVGEAQQEMDKMEAEKEESKAQ